MMHPGSVALSEAVIQAVRIFAVGFLYRPDG